MNFVFGGRLLILCQVSECEICSYLCHRLVPFSVAWFRRAKRIVLIKRFFFLFFFFFFLFLFLFYFIENGVVLT